MGLWNAPATTSHHAAFGCDPIDPLQKQGSYPFKADVSTIHKKIFPISVQTHVHTKKRTYKETFLTYKLLTFIPFVRQSFHVSGTN